MDTKDTDTKDTQENAVNAGIVTLYAPLCGGCMGGLTEPVLDFARQIG